MELLLTLVFLKKYMLVLLLIEELDHAMLMNPEIYLKQPWDGDGR